MRGLNMLKMDWKSKWEAYLQSGVESLKDKAVEGYAEYKKQGGKEYHQRLEELMYDMDTRYNGWSNRETWIVVLWLDNTESNYRWMVDNKKRLLELSLADLKREVLDNCYIGDTFKRSLVNWQEVKNMMEEL